MQKRYLTLTFLSLIILFTLSALLTAAEKEVRANVLLEESFENEFPPSGWASFTDNFMLDGWSDTRAKARTGDYSAIAQPQWVYPIDIWLVTPAIDLSSAPSATLYFYEDQTDWVTNGGTHTIAVSTNSQNVSSDFTTVLEMTPANHTIAGFDGQVMEVDLSAYTGESTVYVGFHYYTSANEKWYIDDVKITTPQDHDVAAFSLDIASYYDPGTLFTPKATVKNVGLNTESFDVRFGYYDWDGSQNVIEMIGVSNLAAGASTQVTFGDYAIGNVEYEFFAETMLSGDMDANNDLVTKWVITGPKKEMVLLEKGTGTWCQYCPASAKAADHLHEEHPDSVAILEYHGYEGTDDPFVTDESLNRINYYGISGYPTAIFNGTAWRTGGGDASADWMPLYEDYEDLYFAGLEERTPFTIDLEFTENGDQISATAYTTYECASYTKANRLYFGLNESHIAYSWQGMDSLHFVFRKIYPDTFGTVLYDEAAAPTAGMVLTNNIEFTIPDGVVKDNCQLIAFIQDTLTKEIRATAKVGLDNPVNDIADNPQSGAPDHYALSQNYPNPFNPSTTISYQTAQSGQVEIVMYNVLGEKIRTLVNRQMNAGQYQITVNAADLASGIYYYRMETENFTKTKKMLLVR